ncbi:MAG: caspase family protein [Alphaproteobacteria bacterium]|nr:caspase family protein [Alphaproteobacteria bacterium]
MRRNMVRHCLLIGSPGKEGTEDHLPGVERDIINYSRFFRSPLGGAWEDHEIAVLKNPSRREVESQIDILSNADFTIAAFCGHGAYGRSTILEIRPGVEIDSNMLSRGGGKHVVVLDCCRVLRKYSQATVLAEFARFAEVHDRDACRRRYDEAIRRSPLGLVVMHACRAGETAEESEEKGGYYSSSLIEAAGDWARTVRNGILTVVEAHQRASRMVNASSSDRQHPTLDKPRSGPYFPFAVMPY